MSTVKTNRLWCDHVRSVRGIADSVQRAGSRHSGTHPRGASLPSVQPAPSLLQGCCDGCCMESGSCLTHFACLYDAIIAALDAFVNHYFARYAATAKSNLLRFPVMCWSMNNMAAPTMLTNRSVLIIFVSRFACLYVSIIARMDAFVNHYFARQIAFLSAF